MIGWAARRPAVVAAFCAAILLAGGMSFTRLPLATRTTIELPSLRVSVAWPGVSAELVEMYLTSPIEAAIQGVRDVRRTLSESNEGAAHLEVELEPKADVQLARLDILERLELLRPELPPGSTAPQVGNFVPEDLAERPLLEYTVSGPYTAGTLTEIVRERVVPRVSAAEGVAGVSQYGGAEVDVSVSYDAARLRQLGIAPSALADALRSSRRVEALGEERLGATERRVSLRDQPAAMEDLANLPIRGPGGRIFHLGELASIRPEEDTRGRFFRINGEPAVSLTIARLPGADAIETAARLRTLLASIQRELPLGVKLAVQSDESIELARQLRDLFFRGAIAFAAVLLVLAVALRNVKSVVLVMGSAAVAVAGTALGLYLLRIPANLLTLAGLSMGIGILVQNGLVVIERLRRAPDTVEGRAEAGRKITPAVIGATLTTAVVLFPFLYLQGNARAAFMPFAAAFALALAWSVLASVVMIPALGAGHGLHGAGWPRLRRLYERAVTVLVRRRRLTLGASVAVLAVLTWGFVKKVPRSSAGLWFGQRTTLSVRLAFPRGSEPGSLDRGMREFEALVVGVPGVEQVVTRGTDDGAFMTVIFEKEAGLSSLPFVLQETLTQRAVLVGGAEVGVWGRGPGFFGGGTTVGLSTFRIKLLGYSFSGVERLALDLEQRLRRIPRVKSVDINAGSFFRRERAYAVALLPDRAALARHGLTVTDFANAVSREVQGAVGSQVLELGGEEVRVTLKAKGARERALEDLRAALIPNAGGAPVRVGDVAEVSEREVLSNISREDQQYVRILSYEFRGPPRLANRTHEAFMRSIGVPAGYTVADDVFEWQVDDSDRGLWLVFGIGVALVLLSVAMIFDSVWAAVVILLSLPLALAGVMAAFWLFGASFSREAAVGVILVVGHGVNQAILLVDGVMERRGAVPAAVDRAGMIVLVTLTTLASLLPLAIGTDVDSLFGAIALATAGGMIAGTLGAMFVVPAMVAGRHRAP